MVGMNLREAADHDCVAFETKRSQFKMACLKIDCSSQNDVVRLVLGQLVHLLNISSKEGNHARATEDFVADFSPPDTQLKVQRLADARLLRIIECGPREGAPLLLHSMMFAPLLSAAVAELQTHKLQLIMPVRKGFLEHSTYAAPFEPGTIDQLCHDIADYLNHFQLGPLPILSHGFACTVALRFAELYSHLATSISLMSFPLRGDRPERDTLHRRFFSSFANLAIFA